MVDGHYCMNDTNITAVLIVTLIPKPVKQCGGLVLFVLHPVLSVNHYLEKTVSSIDTKFRETKWGWRHVPFRGFPPIVTLLQTAGKESPLPW